MVERFAAHDLLRVDPAVASRWPDAAAWVAESLQRAPWAVVRRERAVRSVPIGVRGRRRSERYAAFIEGADVREALSPFACAARAVASGRLGGTFARLAAFAVAARLRIAPTGSYGFELASGLPATHDASDLDVLVEATRVPLRTLRALAAHIAALERTSGVRIDAELEYAAGGVALREVLAGRDRVVFKTVSGPKLLPCPV